MNIYFSDEQDVEVDASGLADFARTVLTAEGFPESTEMAVLLVGSDQMADYNERFMDRKGPTDVLAFPLEHLEPGSVPRLTVDDPPLNLGDVFLCPTEIRRKAVQEGFDPDSFLYLLTAHGILHLIGYDHDNEGDADRMETREDELLGLIGRKVS